MPRPLLETKLFAPKARAGVVPRADLTDRLRRVAESKLTLVSAPAGFGKTTLLVALLARTPTDAAATAWLSLDAGDNDPATFWSYVIAALRKAVPDVGADALAMLDSAQAPEAMLASLVNELSSVPRDIVLVLDDYHVIEAPDIHASLTFLVDHLPARLHLVIATRADPPLPLARLRARGELIEIRAADLRFSLDEAAAYLNGIMGLDLAAGDVAALEGRTEGWIAALQLAGLSMQGRDDNTSFIAEFAGDDRYIVDYLVEEVLHRQPDLVRDFLLRTSILTRLSGPLCDAVTEAGDSKAMLEALDRANLFVVALDDRRRWYRYHHLFADVLRMRLLDEQPDEVPRLHLRASRWHEQQGDHSEAIRHAMAAGDFRRAANLVELAMPAGRRDRRDATWRRWLEELPDELIRAHPVLSNAYAGSLLVRGEVEGVEERLLDVERWLEGGAEAGEMIVADEAAFRALPGAVAVHRAGQARILGDVAGSMAHAHRALDLVDENDHVERGAAASLLGLGHWANGDLDPAYRWFADGMASLEKAGFLADVVGGAVTLADIRLAQGRLGDALRLYERGLALATSRPGPPLRGAADMHVGISAVLFERNDVGGAAEHLDAAIDLGEENGLPKNPYRRRVAAARIRQAHGDLPGALELLDEAERRFVSDFAPDARPVSAIRARLWIAQEALPAAWSWARERGLTASDELTYLHEFEHATLARLLVARGARDRDEGVIGQAVELTERLLAAAEAGGRKGSAIDVLVVQAVARHADGDQAGALTSLARALEMAEPQGYVRVFLDEGPRMTALLRLAAKERTTGAYLRTLLAAAAGSTVSADQPLIEPLSERELEVLHLLETELDGPEIARELVVSLNTVRTHTKNIYAKLGVNSRRAAVRRAAELNLLTRSRGAPPVS